MKRWRFHGELSRNADEHPVDRLVVKRTKARREQGRLAQLTSEIVEALGDRSGLWFEYESRAASLQAHMDAAYFDTGVELGAAAMAAESAGDTSQAIRTLAETLIRTALTSGLSREDANAAVALAAWSIASSRAVREE